MKYFHCKNIKRRPRQILLLLHHFFGKNNENICNIYIKCITKTCTILTVKIHVDLKILTSNGNKT